MTVDPPRTLPPRWAESLLRLLLSRHDRDTVSGDLLEEYRESIVPALGARANRWYLRQVAWYALRASWRWGAATVVILASRNLVESLAPIQYEPRVLKLLGTVTPFALVACFALAAFSNTWRSGHLRSGIIVAFMAAALSGAVASTRATVMLGIWHDPQTLHTIRDSGGLNELLWGIPLELVLIGTICGAVGALLAKTLRWPLVKARSIA